MYVAGTKFSRDGHMDITDALTDIAIPFHALEYTPRFHQAENIFTAHPEITNLVGHSLGAIVVQQIVHRHDGVTGKAYGSPSIFAHERMEYFRHDFDPISWSSLIGGATSTPAPGINPHSHAGFGP